jgi:hypothetical protein
VCSIIGTGTGYASKLSVFTNCAFGVHFLAMLLYVASLRHALRANLVDTCVHGRLYSPCLRSCHRSCTSISSLNFEAMLGRGFC